MLSAAFDTATHYVEIVACSEEEATKLAIEKFPNIINTEEIGSKLRCVKEDLIVTDIIDTFMHEYVVKSYTIEEYFYR